MRLTGKVKIPQVINPVSSDKTFDGHSFMVVQFHSILISFDKFERLSDLKYTVKLVGAN